MPRFLSGSNCAAFARRLGDYVREESIRQCVVVFHGGEPLLMGVDELISFVDILRSELGPDVALDLGMQTNGLLLTRVVLDKLAAGGVSVSLSLDGPKAVNDLHRTSRKGRSSFDRVLKALELLKESPNTFAGIISVIDANASPELLFSFFDEHRPPKLDFLLPDAHHERPPPGKESDPSRYVDWLIRAFDVWFDDYPHLRVRTFEALLDAIAGLPSGTDAFGFGDVSLISVETDGTYHDLDVLKIVGDGATKLSGSVNDTPIKSVAESQVLASHRALLTKEGLCSKCQACPIVDICGGGSLPHRYGDGTFQNPSVYCDELFGLISHVQNRLSLSVLDAEPNTVSSAVVDFELAEFELAETSASALDSLCAYAERDHAASFLEALDCVEAENGTHAHLAKKLKANKESQIRRLAVQPGVVAWSAARAASAKGQVVHDVQGRKIQVEDDYLEYASTRAIPDISMLDVGRDDPWLRLPFGRSIVFESETVAMIAQPLVIRAMDIVRAWRPPLASEILKANRAIQFVIDPTAHPEKIVSFSDDSVPGALFVSVTQGTRMIDPYDLADSIIHEHRHQKLYLLERVRPTVHPTGDLVVSPWREDLRPPAGLLHAVFVFVELQRFWRYVSNSGPGFLKPRAINQLRDTNRNLEVAIETLKGCPLTALGKDLMVVLEAANLGQEAVQ